jgi:phosphate-selective porin
MVIFKINSINNKLTSCALKEIIRTMKKYNALSVTFVIAIVSLLNTRSYAQTQSDSLKQAVSELNKTIDALKRIKINGWVQAQYQWAEAKGAANFDGGDFAKDSDQRFFIRRGRVKFTYNGKLSQFALQLNGSERGVNLVEIFAKVTDPWTKSWSLTTGVMNRPFGFEIDQSSQFRESPERSRYTQILMPNERDLGAKITYEPVKGSKLHGLRLDAGFYNGQGIAVPGTSSATGSTVNDGVNEFDSFKDFIGRLCYYRNSSDEKYRYGIGVSHYNGGIINTTNKYFEIEGNAYQAADTTNHTFVGKSASRKYFGGEVFFSAKSPIGKTTVRGEYIAGTQPGVDNSSRSASTLPNKNGTFIREFNGSYMYLIQRLGESKHELVVKYEWYDPNTKLSGNQISSSNARTGRADVKYTALGLGYNYYYDENILFMFHYNIVTNEKTNITGLEKDLEDNIFTIRMQYRFF